MISACVVKAIRMEFPEESAEYAGFIPAEIYVSWMFEKSSCGWHSIVGLFVRQNVYYSRLLS